MQRIILPAAVLCGLMLGTFASRGAATSPAAVSVFVPIASPAASGSPEHPDPVTIGGPDARRLILHLNVADVQHVLLHFDDLEGATLNLLIKMENPALGKIVLRRMLKPVKDPQAVTEADDEPKVVAEAPLQNGAIVLEGSLTDVLHQQLKDPGQDDGLLLTVQGTASPVQLLAVPAPTPQEAGMAAALSIRCRAYPNVQLFPIRQRPTPGVFTQVNDGHLEYGGQRLRLWGVCRHFWGGTPVLDRLQHMGFNAIRLWGPRNAYDPASAGRGEMIAGEGDPNSEDSLATFDRFFADAKQRGFFIWMEGLHYDPMGIMRKGATDGLDGVCQDDSSVAKQFGTGTDWEAWKTAIRAFTATNKARTWHDVSELMFFDTRLRAIYRQHLINLLDHVNPYTKLRYADDEAIVTWSLNNEEGFATLYSLYGDKQWPPYFHDELQKQWCAWLAKRYQDDVRLQRAWGTVPAGESLNNASVRLAPLVGERGQYPAARSADFVHFLCDVTDSFDQEMRRTCRAQAKAGTGSAVIPITFDTESEPSVPWMYTESLGDIMSFGTYQFTFHSALTVPPALYIMDNQSVAKKPTLIYETESARPDPFRAEFPFRVSTLASWQDWDGVFWHYWKGERSQPDEGYVAAPMDLPRPNGYGDGGIYPDQDPAYCASLAMAGQAFLSHSVSPAPSPVVYQLPMSAVYTDDNIRGVATRRTTFQRGASVSFANGPDAKGPDAKPASQPTEADLAMPVGAVQAGREITYDWPNGRLIVDAPGFKAYIGQPHGAYRFSDGIVLEKVSTAFVAFAMLSTDGKPLTGPDASSRMMMSAQFESKNTNFRMDPGKRRGGESSGWDIGYSNALAAAIVDHGSAPVCTDPVSYQVDFPTSLTATSTNYDFALRETGTTAVAGNQVRHAGGTGASFMSVLSIASRAGSQSTPESSSPAADDLQARGARDPLDLPDPQLASLQMPLPLVGWGESADAVYQYLRDSPLVSGSIKRLASDKGDPERMTVRQASNLIGFDRLPPADLEISFVDHRFNRMTLTFAGTESADQLVTDCTALFGSPATHSAKQVGWTEPAGGGSLGVTLSRQSSHAVLDYQIQGVVSTQPK